MRGHLQGTYVRGREKAGIISYNGHFRSIITRLIENPLLELYGYIRILELYEYIWILFESGIQVPIMVLRLRGRAIDLRDNFPPFLSRNGGVKFSWVRLGRNIK